MALATLGLARADSPAAAIAGCATPVDTAALTRDFLAARGLTLPAGLSRREADCARDRFVSALQDRLGAPVGHKAGLTSEQVQQRFNASSPVRGTLLSNMLLPGGATVSASFGFRPVFEADLLVRIADASVNSAETSAQVAAAIDQVIPFIELPDLAVIDPSTLDSASITAINVGARLGVTGQPLPVTTAQPFERLLRTMTVIVRSNGEVIDEGAGADVLGDPLRAVLWIAEDLAKQGKRLRVGELVSLGSFSRLATPATGQTVEVEYRGLPGNPTVSVEFE
jgi:2-keto-4-pentenoate hydratase